MTLLQQIIQFSSFSLNLTKTEDGTNQLWVQPQDKKGISITFSDAEANDAQVSVEQYLMEVLGDIANQQQSQPVPNTDSRSMASQVLSTPMKLQTTTVEQPPVELDTPTPSQQELL